MYKLYIFISLYSYLYEYMYIFMTIYRVTAFVLLHKLMTIYIMISLYDGQWMEE